MNYHYCRHHHYHRRYYYYSDYLYHHWWWCWYILLLLLLPRHSSSSSSSYYYQSSSSSYYYYHHHHQHYHYYLNISLAKFGRKNFFIYIVICLGRFGSLSPYPSFIQTSNNAYKSHQPLRDCSVGWSACILPFDWSVRSVMTKWHCTTSHLIVRLISSNKENNNMLPLRTNKHVND